MQILFGIYVAAVIVVIRLILRFTVWVTWGSLRLFGRGIRGLWRALFPKSHRASANTRNHHNGSW